MKGQDLIQLYDHHGKPSRKIKYSEIARIGKKVNKDFRAVDTKDGERHYVKD